jgi:hypothetical protein
MLQDQIRKHGDQKALAQRFGVSEGHLSAVLSGTKEPGQLLLNPLGLERVVCYRPKEQQ